MEGTVTISKIEYLNLRISEERLRRLEAGGVDNWMDYYDSLNAAYEPDELDIETWEKDEKKRIEAL